MVSGQNRLDLEKDPPPDLVLEIDVFSLTDVQAYLPLKILERARNQDPITIGMKFRRWIRQQLQA